MRAVCGWHFLFLNGQADIYKRKGLPFPLQSPGLVLWLYKLLRDFEAFTGVLSRNTKSTAGRITKLKALFLAGMGDEGHILSCFKDFCCWRQQVLEKAGCNDLLGNKTMYLLVLHTLHAEGKQISLHLHQKQDYTHASQMRFVADRLVITWHTTACLLECSHVQYMPSPPASVIKSFIYNH